MPYFVYIVTNRSRGTMYIGVTNEIARRYGEHCEGLIPCTIMVRPPLVGK